MGWSICFLGSIEMETPLVPELRGHQKERLLGAVPPGLALRRRS